MSDIEEILAFRNAHVGEMLHYRFRPLGSEEAWREATGIATNAGVTIRTAANGREYDEYFDFPSQDFEYSTILARRNDGGTSRLDPSPPTSRRTSRAASQERQAIFNSVSTMSQDASRERGQLAELVRESEAGAATQRRALHSTLEQMDAQSRKEREQLLEEQRASTAMAAKERSELAAIVAQMAAQSHQERERLLNEQRASAERLLNEQRAAAAAAAKERDDMTRILDMIATVAQKIQQQQAQQQTQQAQQQTQQQEQLEAQRELTRNLQEHLQREQQEPPQRGAPPPHAEERTDVDQKPVEEPKPTGIGRRMEIDLFFPQQWDLTTPEAVRTKRVEVMQFFSIGSTSSPYRWRAFNQLSSWMDAAFEQPMWSEAFANIGATAMENLRAVVAQEDQRVNPRALYSATGTAASDKMGEAIVALTKEAEKRKLRAPSGRGQGRGPLRRPNTGRGLGNATGPGSQ